MGRREPHGRETGAHTAAKNSRPCPAHGDPSSQAIPTWSRRGQLRRLCWRCSPPHTHGLSINLTHQQPCCGLCLSSSFSLLWLQTTASALCSPNTERGSPSPVGHGVSLPQTPSTHHTQHTPGPRTARGASGEGRRARATSATQRVRRDIGTVVVAGTGAHLPPVLHPTCCCTASN